MIVAAKGLMRELGTVVTSATLIHVCNQIRNPDPGKIALFFQLIHVLMLICRVFTLGSRRYCPCNLKAPDNPSTNHIYGLRSSRPSQIFLTASAGRWKSGPKRLVF